MYTVVITKLKLAKFRREINVQQTRTTHPRIIIIIITITSARFFKLKCSTN